MSYTTPRTWTTGETVTAAMMNEQVRDNVGHVYTLARTKTIVIESINFEEPTIKGDGVHLWMVPEGLNGGALVDVHAAVATAGTAGTVLMQVARDRGGTVVDMLTTLARIDANERSSYTGAAGEVNELYAGLETGDWLRIDVDDHGGGTVTANAGQKGLFAILKVAMP